MINKWIIKSNKQINGFTMSCPHCGGFWIDKYFNMSSARILELFTYCPDCGNKLIFNNKEVK